MKSSVDQEINLELPSGVKTINAKNGTSQIKESGKDNSKLVKLPANKSIELEILMR